jgi:hypothetical protein
MFFSFHGLQFMDSFFKCDTKMNFTLKYTSRMFFNHVSAAAAGEVKIFAIDIVRVQQD